MSIEASGTSPLSNARHIAVDLMRALGVLALIFLSFGHLPGAAAGGSDILTVAVNQSFCGDLPDTDRAHAPCHACRVDAALLPPQSGGLLRVPQALRPDAGCVTAPIPVAARPGLPDARAPPRLA